MYIGLMRYIYLNLCMYMIVIFLTKTGGLSYLGSYTPTWGHWHLLVQRHCRRLHLWGSCNFLYTVL